MDTLLGLCIGVALSAACGFRVFVPLLALSLGARAGWLSLGHGFEWMTTWPAVLGFTTAAVLEAGAYLWPWLDHALDTIASPAAVIAGTLATASQIDGMNPALTWVAALIAGGGVAGLTQTATVTTRGASTVATGGLLNPVMGVVQAVISTVLSILAVVVPVLAGIIVLGTITLVVVKLRKRARARRDRREAEAGEGARVYPALAA